MTLSDDTWYYMKIDCEWEKKTIKKPHKDKSKKIRKKIELTS